MIAPRPRGLKLPASPRRPGAGPAARLLAALAVAALAALLAPSRPPDAITSKSAEVAISFCATPAASDVAFSSTRKRCASD